MKRIRATKLGFLPGATFHRVRVGQVVEVPDDFQGDWFEVISSDKPQKAQAPEPVAMSQIAKQKVKGPTDPIA